MPGAAREVIERHNAVGVGPHARGARPAEMQFVKFDVAPGGQLHGTAFGFFNLVSGIATLIDERGDGIAVGSLWRLVRIRSRRGFQRTRALGSWIEEPVRARTTRTD
jgi:hypothetical protein